MKDLVLPPPPPPPLMNEFHVYLSNYPSLPGPPEVNQVITPFYTNTIFYAGMLLESIFFFFLEIKPFDLVLVHTDELGRGEEEEGEGRK